MKKIFFIFVIIILTFNIYSEDNIYRNIENKAFYPGEKLTFQLRWSFIHAGTATMELSKDIPINNREVWRITAIGLSNSFIDTFFRVRDTNESWIDAEGIFSYRFKKSINEGDYHKEEETIYDYEKMKVIVLNRGEESINSFTHDVLSGFYYARTQKLDNGDEFYLDVTTELKKWKLRVRVIGEDILETKWGTLKTKIIEPYLSEEGIFKQKGSLKIWVTDDESHTPIKMASKVFIGSIVAELIDYQMGEK